MRLEWPGRLRRRPPPPTRAGPVVFMGDSITFSWPELFGRSGLVNRGVAGETTRQMLARFPEQVLQAGASGVHILGGVNDIAGNGGSTPLEETRANLRAMAELGRAHGLKVWLASVLPVHGVWWAPAVTDPEAVIAALNRGLEADAHALGVDYLDYHARLADAAGRLRPSFGVDGVHLSPAGYAEIAPLTLAALRVR